MRPPPTLRGFPREGRVVVLHAALSDDACPDEQDVLEEVTTVQECLEALGYTPVVLPCTLDLTQMVADIKGIEPTLVFNLVETLDGDGQLAHLAPAVLEHLGVPFTGSPAAAILSTSGKLLAKQMMRAARVPTPGWLTLDDARSGKATVPAPAIIKPVWEDASVGIDEDSVVFDESRVIGELERRSTLLGTPCFAEAYIHGRELNVAALAGQGGPFVLPPAEMVFHDFEAGRPRVMGYRAKWDVASPEYQQTRRTFEFSRADTGLLRRVRRLVLACWRLFGLKGWARVDLRVDDAGVPWVLEVNANPCISPGAGFLVAAERAGLDPVTAVAHIIGDLNLPTQRRVPTTGLLAEEELLDRVAELS
jgi:D-alanine-D-alanine ligase